MSPGRTFVPDYSTDAICEHLDAVLAGQIDQLQIWVPPGCYKSSTVCVAFPAYSWIRYPGLQFTCASNTEKNAKRDSIAGRQLVLSELYQSAYVRPPEQPPRWVLRHDQDTVHKWENTLRGWRELATVGMDVTGLKADIQILDDPMDANSVHSEAYRRHIHSWYDLAFANRVNDYKTARRVMMGHRTHTDDLQSHTAKQGGWVILNLPEQATDRPCRTEIRTRVYPDGYTDPRSEGEWLRPERFGPAEAEKERRRLGPIGYAAQHQQSPQSREGRMFDRAQVKWCGAHPVPIEAVRYFDIASSTRETACWTAGVLLGRDPDNRCYVLDWRRRRLGPAERNAFIISTGREDMRRPGVQFRRLYFEQQPAAAGVDHAHFLTLAAAGLPIEADRATGDKFTRAEPAACQWAAGNVYVLDAPWALEFLDCMEVFGPGAPANDLDTGDAFSGGYNRLFDAPVGMAPLTGPNPTPESFGQGTFRGDVNPATERW